jgi:hypothetical protein
MTPDELLQTMREVLEQERDGIRRLDASAVTKATDRKEEIMKNLLDAPPAERAPLIAALGELRNDLRRNLVLLAHARDYLRDAVTLCKMPGGRGRLEAKL